jgi:hypothetical protein
MRVEKSEMVEATETTSFDEGRELDALIAERVMGWTRHPEKMHPTDNRTIGGVLYCPPGSPYNHGGVNVVPYYSTRIDAAWEVVEKHPAIVVQRATSRDGSKAGYMCSLPLEPNDPRRAGQRITSVNAEADTAPLAICRAALKAVADKEVVSARSALSTNSLSARATEGETK